MGTSLQQQPAAAWIAALQGTGDDRLLGELEDYLRRTLARTLGGQLGEHDIAELVQESFVRMVERLDSFRGDSAFTTWATAVALRVTFTELRRRQARRERDGDFLAIQAEVAELPDPGAPPEKALSRAALFQALEHAIATDLTERQRVAILSELRGLPTVEVAERMGTHQNALYKLVHDARKKLRKSLLQAGFDASAIHDLSLGESR